MFKKLIPLVLIIMCFNINTVFAGDIPEALMLGEHKSLFIGKITGIDSKTCTIKPITIMMGSIEKNEIIVDKFSSYYGNNEKPLVNDVIVAVLLEEDEIDNSWVFKATSDNYKTLRLVSKRYEMVKTYERYINNGDYFKAQKNIDSKINQNSEILSDDPEEPVKTYKINLVTVLLIVGGILYLTFYRNYKKLKK